LSGTQEVSASDELAALTRARGPALEVSRTTHNQKRGLLSEPEVGSTTAINPDLAPVITPGLSLNAWRSATLVDHADAAAGVRVAVVSFAVVGGTGDLSAAARVASSTAWIPATTAAVIATTQPEVGAAAPIDPDAIAVKTPGLVLDAWRSAALVDHANAVLGGHLAKMAFAVIGCTRNLASVLRGNTALRAHPDTTECHCYPG
jgi:hypothetical protein